MAERTIIVIGAGPAGLTAARELVRRGARPLVLEADDIVGGLSRTVVHAGNRMDIGGHRFFSKSDAVMRWWLDVLPLQGAPARDQEPGAVDLAPAGPDPEREDRVMLQRSRRSRIHFLDRLFPYPLTLDLATLRGLGLRRTLAILGGYVRARLAPRPERSLADFFVNRFGGELYRTFFRDYTEKVWGTPCTRMRPDWGVQRVRSLSVAEVLRHAFRRGDGSVAQRGTATSLIERFLYPKYGPGQLWERVAGSIGDGGGEVRFRRRVDRLVCADGRIREVEAVDPSTGERESFAADAVISTMALDEVVGALGDVAPPAVRAVGAGLRFRAFVTVGLLVGRCAAPGDTGPVRDNWIYVQERRVRLARIQLFNNWSPYLVADPSLVWLGCEYFCDAGDEFWHRDDAALADLAATELADLGYIDRDDVRDSVVVRMPKAYPTYGGSYHRLGVLRDFLDGIPNLYPAGRNGMHRYNNMDHSMLAAMAAVDLLGGTGTRAQLWAVNADAAYHEERR